MPTVIRRGGGGVVKGMVFNQIGIEKGTKLRAFWSTKGYLITGKLIGGVKKLDQNGFEKLANIKSEWNRDNFVDREMVFH